MLGLAIARTFGLVGLLMFFIGFGYTLLRYIFIPPEVFEGIVLLRLTSIDMMVSGIGLMVISHVFPGH